MVVIQKAVYLHCSNEAATNLKPSTMFTLSSFIASSLSNSSKLDAADALTTCGGLDSDWIYSVDPETYAEVKAAYRAYSEVDGGVSLYNVFCAVARQGKPQLTKNEMLNSQINNKLMNIIK